MGASSRHLTKMQPRSGPDPHHAPERVWAVPGLETLFRSRNPCTLEQARTPPPVWTPPVRTLKAHPLCGVKPNSLSADLARVARQAVTNIYVEDCKKQAISVVSEQCAPCSPPPISFKGTSLITNSPPSGLYRRTISRAQQGPMVVLGRVGVSYERGTFVASKPYSPSLRAPTPPHNLPPSLQNPAARIAVLVCSRPPPRQQCTTDVHSFSNHIS